MLRPEPMTRVLVAGPKDQLEPMIESLYALKLVHLVDHHGEDDVITIGKPLAKAAEVSEQLVRLRSIANILNVAEAKEQEPAEPTADLRQQIVTLEVNLREEDEARKRMESLISDLDRRIESLRPFAILRVPLETYRGYTSLEVLVGRVTEDVIGLEAVAPENEVVAGEGVVAVFVPTASADKVREFLTKFGFAPVDVPQGEGSPANLLAAAESDRQKWSDRLVEIEDRIGTLRAKYAQFVVKAEDVLEVEIEKAEAPLRFAASEHSFVVDGWMPSSRVDDAMRALAGLPGVLVESMPDDESHEEADAPPVLLKHKGAVKRFEFLTKLYSTPSHDEVDPTAFLFLLFPLFFGLMIGDAGYGIVMIILGFVLSSKLKDSPDFADLMRVILYGGVFAYIFGMVLYGEIFGIPFHPPVENPHELSWSALLGYYIPYEPPIHKLEAFGVIDLLLLSVVASVIHLSIGYVVGFVNEIHHNKKHAASRVGWLFVLVGLFAFFAVLGRSHDLAAPVPRVVNFLFFDRPPLAWIPAAGLSLGSMSVPYFSIALIVIGIAILLPTEGGLAPVETISLLANMMSYTRLAGVAVAKGAVALAFNTMLLPLIINEDLFVTTGAVQFNANVAFIILGFVLIFLAHAMVLILGAISASIQAIRLNYVEFFLKFYKGGGTLFSPFGARKRKMEA